MKMILHQHETLEQIISIIEKIIEDEKDKHSGKYSFLSADDAWTNYRFRNNLITLGYIIGEDKKVNRYHLWKAKLKEILYESLLKKEGMPRSEFYRLGAMIWSSSNELAPDLYDIVEEWAVTLKLKNREHHIFTVGEMTNQNGKNWSIFIHVFLGLLLILIANFVSYHNAYHRDVGDADNKPFPIFYTGYFILLASLMIPLFLNHDKYERSTCLQMCCFVSLTSIAGGLAEFFWRTNLSYQMRENFLILTIAFGIIVFVMSFIYIASRNLYYADIQNVGIDSSDDYWKDDKEIQRAKMYIARMKACTVAEYISYGNPIKEITVKVISSKGNCGDVSILKNMVYHWKQNDPAVFSIECPCSDCAGYFKLEPMIVDMANKKISHCVTTCKCSEFSFSCDNEIEIDISILFLIN